jgi:hypothetical protein
MKVIDQTPLQNEKGEIGIVQRVQGTLKYGFEWYPEMEAQKTVLAHLSRALGKGYTVIRNQTLGASGITIPLSVVGPAGIYAAYVTHVRGTYQARRDSWGQMFGINFQPSRVNLMTRTQLLARALQAFIERQGVKLPKQVEPVILAANPGLHLESMQPITRIVLADALERWAASLESAAPLFTVETAYELADRIVNPRPPKKEEPEVQPKDDSGLSRTGADPNELEFAFEEGASNPATPASSQGEVKRRILGMTLPQLVLLGGMILVEVCVLIGLAVFIFLNTNLL